jgi:hypothetical protein
VKKRQNDFSALSRKPIWFTKEQIEEIKRIVMERKMLLRYLDKIFKKGK